MAAEAFFVSPGTRFQYHLHPGADRQPEASASFLTMTELAILKHLVFIK